MAVLEEPEPPHRARHPACFAARMRLFFRNNGLSIVLFGLFLSTLGGQAATGWREHVDTQREHGEEAVGFREYLTTGHFWEATSENWESEFLQMAMFIVLTAFLFQKG